MERVDPGVSIGIVSGHLDIAQEVKDGTGRIDPSVRHAIPVVGDLFPGA